MSAGLRSHGLGLLRRLAGRAVRLPVACGMGAGVLGASVLFAPQLADADAGATPRPATLSAAAAPTVGAVQLPLESSAPEPAAPAEAEHTWPVFTMAQVAEHDTKEKGIWVSYKDGVCGARAQTPPPPDARGKARRRRWQA